MSKKSEKSRVGTSHDLLLENYLKAARKYGARNVTLQIIADEAKVAFGTVRYYFAEKGLDLETEALRYMMQKAYQFLDSSISEDRREKNFQPVNSYIHHMLSWVLKYPHHASFLFYYYYLCTTKVETPIPNQVFLERAYSRIESLLNESIGLGILPQLKSKTELARSIQIAVLGATATIATSPTKEVLALQLKSCSAQVEILVNAYKP